jgi:hypothetical protein
MYRAGTANERADALSRKHEDVKSQEEAIKKYRTQILLPRDKIDPSVVDELQLAPIDTTTELEQGYDSLQLVDKILTENRTSPELQELRTKAASETEETWQLRDGLLLRYGKLYIPDGMITD